MLEPTPDGRYALIGSFDNAARLWDVETGTQVRVFTHPAAVFAVTFSPDGRYILTGSFFDGRAWLWEVNTGREVRQFPGYTGFVNGLSFSPDGKTIITAAEGTTGQLWEVETGQPLERFPGDVGRFSADGKSLLTGGLKTVNLWDRATGKQHAHLWHRQQPVDSGTLAWWPVHPCRRLRPVCPTVGHQLSHVRGLSLYPRAA